MYVDKVIHDKILVRLVYDGGYYLDTALWKRITDNIGTCCCQRRIRRFHYGFSEIYLLFFHILIFLLFCSV